MACFSTSLKNVVENSAKARDQVEKLQVELEKTDSTNINFFDKARNEFFLTAGLDDVKHAGIARNIKVEFASEFSLDKVIPVIEAAIQAAVENYSKPIGANTQKAFSDLVTAIGECAKFSSSANTSMSFATNRLSSGLFVSLYAASVAIEDKNMFGKKAVTATMFYYQLSTSNKDINADMMRDLTLLYAEGVINLNKKVLELAYQVAAGDISIEVYNERRETIETLINGMKPSLATFKNANLEYHKLVAKMVENEKIDGNATKGKKRNIIEMINQKEKSLSLELVKKYNDSLTELLK